MVPCRTAGAHVHLRLLLLLCLAAPAGNILEDGFAHLLRVGKLKALLSESVGVFDVT